MNRVTQLMRKAWYSLLSDHPYSYPGRVLIKVLPASYKSELNNSFFSGDGRPNILARIFRAGINAHYYSRSEEEIRKLNREQFWGSAAGKRWHSLKRELYRDHDRFKEYLDSRNSLISQIERLLSKSSSYHTICEIGTGNGIFLHYLSNRFRNIERFIGIDLNEEQVVENNKEFKDVGLEFVRTEVSDWISPSIEGTIFVTNGTFEYFTRRELQDLLTLIRDNANPSAVVIREPINIDLSYDMVSRPRGNIAFSHNYPHLFQQCGYKIFCQELKHVDSDQNFYNIITMAATTN